jgi:hypothetical protein
MLVGDLQLFLALGELGRHVVERRGKRREFGDPGLLRRAHVQIAAAEPRGGAHQRPDRTHDELFTAEPRQDKNEQAEHNEPQIGDVDLAIDLAVHGVLVKSNDEARLRPGART